MSLSAESVDSTQPDGGLAGVFAAAGVPEEVKTYLTETCMVKNVDNFLDYVVRKKFEEEISEIVKAKFAISETFTHESQRLYISKLRGAYRVALLVEESAHNQRAKKANDQTETDLERPLDPDTVKDIKAAWRARHTWDPVDTIRAAPHLRNRVYREFHNATMTLMQVEKAQHLKASRIPKERKRHPLGTSSEDTLYIETAAVYKRKVNTPLEYYAALRTIMGLYAYCGTFEVQSKSSPGSKVLFFSWQDAITYVDESMHNVLTIAIPEEAKLHWWRTRDETVRTEMAALVNDQWPAGEALKEAVKANAHHWEMADAVVAAPEDGDEDVDMEPRHGARPQQAAGKGRGKRPRVGGGSSSRGSQGGGSFHMVNGRAIRKITTDSRGTKYCGAWNSERGCTRNQADCPQEAVHACNVSVAKGKACGDPKHTCAGHHFR